MTKTIYIITIQIYCFKRYSMKAVIMNENKKKYYDFIIRHDYYLNIN